MRTYDMYFSGPSDPDLKFPDAPTPREMYDDFQRVMKDSGYIIRKSWISTNNKNKNVVIEVNGFKP